MTVALRSPKLVGALISVDNAPVDAKLANDFDKYLVGMQEIEEAEVKKQAEADRILRKYENVCPSLAAHSTDLTCLSHRFYPSGNFS